MDSVAYFDIIKILRKANREDLVDALEEALDKDYKPPPDYETDDGISSGEEESLSVSVDKDGFLCLI